MSIYRRRPFPIHLAVAVLSKGEQEEEEGKMTKNHRADEFPFFLSLSLSLSLYLVGPELPPRVSGVDGLFRPPSFPPSSFLSGKKRVPPPVIN